MKENKASIKNFPMTDAQWVCKRCFFRELCYNTRNWPPDAPVTT
jgi:hypothetical protein